MEGYKNILANKFMRDTNYIIIKDTDDLEELERQYELFTTQLTTRQQRLSDDRSIEIWNMTNQEHYEALKKELMNQIDNEYNDSEEDNDTYYYDAPSDEENNDDESISDDDITYIWNKDFDQDETEYEEEEEESDSFEEDTEIPIDNSDIEIINSIKDCETIQKDNQADQYEIDSNINIIGRINGDTKEERLDNLEKAFDQYNLQSNEHKKKSDDKCIEIYGIDNTKRYMQLKNQILGKSTPDDFVSNDMELSKLEFVSKVYDNMRYVNESEQIKVNKHKRFNDTPYFTPTELIDMGVHGNHNFYSPEPDNDGLITRVRIPVWFDSYKDMCLDHIFEDYRKDWIDTLDMLYSDFDDIKASGDEKKILARKQSILDLGWNPEIKFNRKNRLKASKRVSDILDKTIPSDIFIDLNTIPDEIIDDSILEQINIKTHKPVLLIFTQGKTPVVSQGIKLFTGSEYSHASISFDPELKEVYSYNMRGENFGFIKENLSSFKDNFISVMAFFAPNNIVDSLKNRIEDFKNNKTTFDLRIFLNKILHIDHKVSKNEYRQVCSTFVDNVLRTGGGINLTGDIEIPDPGQLYNAAKSMPNKIIEVFSDIATKYNGKSVKRKINALFKSPVESIEEACKDLKSTREFVSKVGELAKKYDANYFIVTDGASGIYNNGNPAVKNARDSQIKWKKKHGFDPDEDWSKKIIEESISILNEVKQFPVEFDKDGNLIIYKARTNSLSYGDEIDDSVQLLESYRNSFNIEGMKYEIAKLWYINDCIEKKLKKRLTNDQYKELIDTRAVCLNAFKFNLDFIMKSEKGFNFSDYYNSTPFSDNSIKVTANTLKYTMKTLSNLI